MPGTMKKPMMGGGMMKKPMMKKGGMVKLNPGLKAFLMKKKKKSSSTRCWWQTNKCKNIYKKNKSYGWWFYGKEINVCLEMLLV